MSTSEKNNQNLKTLIMYSCITIFCGIFSIVYEHFSHGVYSNYMVYLFLFPLILGGIPYIIFTIIKAKLPTSSRYPYHAAIATLTIGSALKGIFDIYGTTNALVNIYWIVGILLLIISIVLYIIYLRKSSQNSLIE